MGWGRATIDGRDPDRDILLVDLRILHRDVEEPVVVEDAGVDEFILGALAGTATVFGNEVGVGKDLLRILVEQAHEGMRRQVVDVEVVVFHVLAMIALERSDAEEPLLQVVVVAVPESRGEAEHLVAVAEPRDTVLAPAEGATAGVVIVRRGPGVAVGRVVFANRAPAAIGDVRAPSPPAEGVALDRSDSLLLDPVCLGCLVLVTGHDGTCWLAV